jgi:ligand-binding sensor domain-containing protein/two-component sensor histidine kinase
LSQNDENIVSIFEDHLHTLWLATWGQGLINVVLGDEEDIRKETVEFTTYQKGPGSTISNFIWSLEEDSFGNLWIGTYSGLNKYNRQRNKINLYRHSESDPRTLSSNQIASLYEDKSGVLWIGAYQGGIDKYILHTNKFQHFRHDPFNPNSLSLNNVGSLFEDSKGFLWIGTLGGGLNRYNVENGIYTHFKNSPGEPGKLSSNYITSIDEDSNGTLWMSTDNGLNYFDSHGDLKQFLHKSDKSNGISRFMINTIFSDQNSNIWIGTNKEGLYRLGSESIKTGEYEQYTFSREDSNSISHNNVLSITEDKRGTIWVGSYDGLNEVIMDPDDSERKVIRFKRYKFDSQNIKSISNYNIYTIYEDKNQVLWLGTSRGLNKFEKENDKFSYYTEKHGLPNNVINGILEDKNGHLWVSTNKGLSQFDPMSETFKNFDAQDGLQSNVFGLNANCMLESGQLAFGGINGFNIFDPSDITSNAYIPDIVITDFNVYGESVQTNRDIHELDEIRLSYEENFITIEYAALDFTNPEKNQYAYKLEGFNDDWIYPGNNNTAVYTNLNPGSYTFKVIGSNNDGIWNEEGASLNIIILPPFWQTLWFRLILVLLFLLGLYLLIHVIRDREKKNSEIREKMTELRMQALRAKMNPHFIFNTINSIQYFLTSNEKRTALEYLSKFARLMRLTLEFSDKTSISISEELESLRLYLDLEKLRFENKFDYEIDVDPHIDTLRIMIPNMLIQPYVENAVKHGIQNKMDTGMVKISLKKGENEIYYVIEDNGIGIRKSLELKQHEDIMQKSSGMEITRNRINMLNLDQKENERLEITDLSEENAEKTGTKVEITIPIIDVADTV